MRRTSIVGVIVVIGLLIVGAIWWFGARDTPDPSLAADAPSATPLATAAPAVTPTIPPPSPSKFVVGYFTEWGTYDRNYHVKNLVTSGAADVLTHINYAFANISPDLECALGDTFADYERAYTAAESVDGVADSEREGLRGSFNQFRKLKIQYPDLKVMISVGGGSWSDKFSDAALTADSRENFVRSCIDLYLRGQFAAGLNEAGIFDGIDVDWEYPGSCGATCNFRPEDTQNFTLLLAEFDRQLNTLEAETGREYLLTIAVPTAPDTISKFEIDAIHPYLDFINVMTYDFHGTWDNTVNFNAPLYGNPDDPSYGQGLWVEAAVQAWLDGGTPANKLVVGIPFYGRGWSGVPAENNGVYQTATGAATATYEAGIEDYNVLNALDYERFYDPITGALYIYNADTQIWWSYDDATTIAAKMEFVRTHDLAGAMIWELSGDDEAGTLIQAIEVGLNSE